MHNIIFMEESSKELIKFYISSEELSVMICELENLVKKANRLHSVQQIYKRHSVRKTCLSFNILVSIDYN